MPVEHLDPTECKESFYSLLALARCETPCELPAEFSFLFAYENADRKAGIIEGTLSKHKGLV